MKTAAVSLLIFIFLVTVAVIQPGWLQRAVDQALQQYPDQPLVQSIGESLERPLAMTATFHKLEPGSDSWLMLGRKLAKENGQVAFQLYQHYQKQHQTVRARLWLKRAIALNNDNAIALKADSDITEGRGDDAEQLIGKLEKQSQLFWPLSLRLALLNEQESKIIEAITTLENSEPTNPLLEDVERFSINDYWLESDREDFTEKRAEACPTKVQFYAGSLLNLYRIENLKEQLNDDAFFAEQFCILPPKYIPKSVLACDSRTFNRLQCNIEAVMEQAGSGQADYIGVLADKGKANVNHGVLYLDYEDSVDVFKHELLHLIGFIDEYPLPENHQVCQVERFSAVAKNIVVDTKQQTYFESEQQARDKVLAIIPWGELITPTTPITRIIDGRRVLGTPDAYIGKVGLFAAQTCDRQNRMSFKPEYDWGVMRYNSLGFSDVYQQIHELDTGRFAMKKHSWQPALQPEEKAD